MSERYVLTRKCEREGSDRYLSSTNEFGKYFKATFSNDNNVLPEFKPNSIINNILNDICFEDTEIFSVLNNISNSESVGPDGLSAYFLKRISSVICLPLSLIFQRSLHTGILPPIWKTAHVVPIFKGKGSKLFVCNYRPISLTCVICKVVETIIRSRILKHCTDNNILNTDQHGFMSNKSTVTNLVEMLNHITAKLDMGSCIDLLCIDFAKAFDSVSHDKLLYKLYAYGIRGNVLNWISGFLKNRTFKVKVNNSFSDIFDVCSSVPQGSVLGPLLFLLYVNDITSAVKNSYVKLYADDLSVFRVINNTCDAKLLQNDLEYIYQWANLWQLKINFDKCRCMHFGYSSIHNVYNINNVPIAVSVCERILGVYIDSSLSFSEHVFNIVKKARVTCNLIFNAFHFCDNQVLINLFKVYVRPQLEYASVVFSPRFLYLTDLLENVQRNFTKRLTGLNKMHYIDRLNICNLESLEYRRICHDLTFLYKYLHGFVEMQLQDCIVRNVHEHNLRGNVYKLIKFYSRLDIRKQFFANRVINYWNNLEDIVVCARAPTLFKLKLKENFVPLVRGRALQHAI